MHPFLQNYALKIQQYTKMQIIPILNISICCLCPGYA